jgi:hypothetical protein
MQDTLDSIHSTSKNKRKNERKKRGKKEGRIKGRKKGKRKRHKVTGILEKAQYQFSTSIKMTYDFIGKLSREQYLELQEKKESPYFRTHQKEETSFKHKPPLHIDPGWWKMLPSQPRS